MNDRQIVISEPNARVLRSLLRTRNGATHDQEHLDDLRVELERALVLEPRAPVLRTRASGCPYGPRTRSTGDVGS